MLCLNRLLHSTAIGCILVLAGAAPLKPRLKQVYADWISREDGTPLAKRYPAQFEPTASLAQGIRVCLSSIRELQLLIQGDEALPKGAFDAIVIYDLFTPSVVWYQVLEYFEAPYRICFSVSA